MDEEEGEVDQVQEPDSTQDEEEAKPKEEKRPSQSSRKDSKKSRTSSLGVSQQQLFLVEFLVDTVSIDSCSVDEEVLRGQTCLSLSFLNFPPMEICEKDFDPNRQTDPEKVRFNCGKSLMFAFNENQCEHPPPLSVEITVFKKLEEDDNPNPIKVEIGVIKICISELFRQIVSIAKFNPEKLPASKSIKDCFMLIGPGKRTMGQVSVYIRLSCLGQNVVTEFQCGPDLKTSPVLFKSREGRKMFEFTGSDAFSEGGETTRGKPGCGCIQPQNGQAPRGGQGDGGKSPLVNATYSQGNRIVLDIPDKSGRCKGSRKVDRCKGEGNRAAQDSLTDKTKTEDGMTVSRVASNPDHNVFVLKVGDKGLIPDRGKMILEFKTPKQKIPAKILPPYHEEVAVQTDSGKKGKGKGKKKK